MNPELVAATTTTTTTTQRPLTGGEIAAWILGVVIIVIIIIFVVYLIGRLWPRPVAPPGTAVYPRCLLPPPVRNDCVYTQQYAPVCGLTPDRCVHTFMNQGHLNCAGAVAVDARYCANAY